MTAFLERDEPEDGFFNGATDGEETVVLKKRGLLVAEGCGNVFAFFFC